MESLNVEIEKLSAKKAEIEKIFNGETPLPDNTDFDTLSKHFSELKDTLDEKELRWLELSEKEG